MHQRERHSDEWMKSQCEKIIDRCAARHPGIYSIQKIVETEISAKEYGS